MNIDRLLRFLTEDEKFVLHLFYPSYEYDEKTFTGDMKNALINLRHLDLIGRFENENKEPVFKLTSKGRGFCDAIVLY